MTNADVDFDTWFDALTILVLDKIGIEFSCHESVRGDYDASGGMELFERYSTLKAKCAELEAQLYAIGAGGVGQSIKPQVQVDTAQEPGTRIPASVPTGWKLVPMEPTAAMLDAAFNTEVVHTEWGVDAFVENTDEVYGAMLAAAPEAPAQQEPVAWMYEWNGRTHITTTDQRPIEHAHPHFNKSKPLYTAPQPTENLNCKSTQKRLATLWGYVKQESARQPLTDEQIMELAEPFGAFEYGDAQGHKRQAFARAIEETCGITRA